MVFIVVAIINSNMSEAIEQVNHSFGYDLKSLKTMLKTNPVNAGVDQSTFWQRMKPMTVELY